MNLLDAKKQLRIEQARFFTTSEEYKTYDCCYCS
jgi:hypothetical protein